MRGRVNVLCMKCGGDILAPPALCGNCASAIPPREPTEKMIEAGADDFLAVTEHAYAIFSRDLASVWSAMYDAALAEKDGK